MNQTPTKKMSDRNYSSFASLTTLLLFFSFLEGLIDFLEGPIEIILFDN